MLLMILKMCNTLRLAINAAVQCGDGHNIKEGGNVCLKQKTAFSCVALTFSSSNFSNTDGFCKRKTNHSMYSVMCLYNQGFGG